MPCSKSAKRRSRAPEAIALALLAAACGQPQREEKTVNSEPVAPLNAPSRAFIALTSPPAEKARPAPVSTTQRISRSALIAAQASATWSPSPGAPSAFMASGRLSVRMATWPRFSVVIRDMGGSSFALSYEGARSCASPPATA